MFCGKCGAPIMDGARHCSRCGAPFKMRPRRSEIERRREKVLTPPYPVETPEPMHNSKGPVRNMGHDNKGGDSFFAPPDL